MPIQTGVSSTQELPAHVDSGGMEAFNFGVDAGVSMVLGIDLGGGETFEHDGDMYHFALGTNSNLPMWYPTGNMSSTYTRSYKALGVDEYELVCSLAERYSEGWLRDRFGRRVFGRIEFSTSWEMRGAPMYWDVDATVEREPFEEARNG